MDKFGTSVFTTDNPAWKRQRKVVATVLNEKISASVFSESLKQTDGMLEELFGPTDKPAQSVVTAQVFDMMKKITIHVLSGAGMGLSPSWDNIESERPKPGSKMSYIGAMKIIIDCMAGPMVVPRAVARNRPPFLPGAALFRKLGLAMEEYAQHTNEMLESKMLELKADQQQAWRAQKPDILTQLVAASAEAGEQDAKTTTKYGALTKEEMSGNLFIFNVAGFDTTANTLSYALAYLARYPQWQDWLLEEIDDIIPRGAETDLWDYANTYPRARRVLAFMLETLRLNPPIIHVCHLGRMRPQCADQRLKGNQDCTGPAGHHCQPRYLPHTGKHNLLHQQCSITSRSRGLARSEPANREPGPHSRALCMGRGRWFRR